MSDTSMPNAGNLDALEVIRAEGSPVAGTSIVAEAKRQAADFSDECGEIVNLCEDRLSFLSTLLAAALTDRVTVLPSDRSLEGLRSAVAGRYPNATILCDSGQVGKRVAAAGLQAHTVGLSLQETGTAPNDGLDPVVLDRAGIVMFTSGSTGTPEPCMRNLSFFRQGAVANAECMFQGFNGRPGIVATVPPYHMFGFELSIAVPLFAGARLYSGRPFYPVDVAAALESVAAPRILVSTPVHLRVLLESGLGMPRVERVFSATAPLSASLAGGIEKLFCAEVREIFGTTETGSIGWRKTADEEAFNLMPGSELTQRAQGSLLSAPHIVPPFELADRLELLEGRRFCIVGRSNDIVNIAGKRMSLAGMNAILADLDGVVDGAFLPPGDDADGPVERMSAIVVAPGLTDEEIRQALRQKLDSAFIPRRIAFVERLPRNAAGKLPLEEFTQFAREALVEAMSAERTVCFGSNEPWAKDHFPGQAIVPGALLLGEASAFLSDWLGKGETHCELVNARFPDSAVPGKDCIFRIEPAAADQYRIECRQEGRLVMRASMRMPGGTDG
jgi:acyl-CoA synthetase (AMP-forming)/AMP-acid ligase II